MGPNRTFIISTYLKLLSFDLKMVLVDLARIYYLSELKNKLWLIFQFISSVIILIFDF